MARYSDHMDPADRRSPWWDKDGVLIALALLSAVPLIWPAIPPLVDLPGHMGRYAVQVDGGVDPVLGRYFGFEWRLIGNLGVDLLVQALHPLMGVEAATKLVVLLIPPLTALGFLLTARAVQGRVGPTALFALPLAYGFPFQFGFVNYALSMAFAFLAFAGWLTLADRGRFRLRAAIYLVVSGAVWVTHVYGWGVLGLLAFSAEFHRVWRGGRRWWDAAWRGALACWPLTPPLALMILWRSEAAGGTGYFFLWTQKLVFVANALRDRWELFDALSVAALFVVLWIAVRHAGARYGPRLAWGAVAMLVAYLLMPRILIGSNYSDMRMAPFILAALLLSIRVEDRRLAGRLALAGLAFVLVRTAATTASYWLYDRDAARQLAAIEHIRPGARVVALVHKGCGEKTRPDRSYHLPSLAIVRRHAFVNDQWQMAGAQLIRVRYEAAAPFVSDPSQIVTPVRCGEWRTQREALDELPWGGFDHLWLMNIDPAVWPRDPRLRPVWRSGESVLYNVVSADGRRPAGTPRTAAARARPGGVQGRTRPPAAG